MGTICNMGAEIGATTSMFPYNRRQYDYLVATGREKAAKLAEAFQEHLKADEGAEYDQIVELNLTELEPQVWGRALQQLVWPLDMPPALHASAPCSSWRPLDRARALPKQSLHLHADQSSTAGERGRMDFTQPDFSWSCCADDHLWGRSPCAAPRAASW